MKERIERRGALIALAAVVILGCGRGTQPSQDVSPGVTPAPSADVAAASAVTEYPRPAKPSRQYRIGVAIPHLSNPHYVGQAYGYIDEAQALGAQVTLLEAGGYQYLDKQVAQVEDLI
ncbi:MAG TPA: hypothetical protein VKC35_02430, partial [Vicinamibacterales bacterium]|nr:hypothetical protein [Vicinamibacterales bacterium]